MYTIPVFRIDKTTKEEIPEWIHATDIITTGTLRMPGKTVKTYVTNDGEYQQIITVDLMMQLLDKFDFLSMADRGSMININYVKEIDTKWNVAIVADIHGAERRVNVLASKIELLKYRLQEQMN